MILSDERAFQNLLKMQLFDLSLSTANLCWFMVQTYILVSATSLNLFKVEIGT